MCIIIQRFAKQEIPFDKLQAACKRNPHGYGITYFDGRDLQTTKGYQQGGTDPEYIARQLEETKDVDTVLHLRFATVGGINVENTHPVRLTADDLEVDFFHNGTLHGYGDKEKTDTHDFGKKIVEPLLRRNSFSLSPEDLINDELFLRILDEFAGTSTFTLFDSYGNIRWVNEDQRGDVMEWGRVSNRYSLNPYHTPQKSDTTTHYLPSPNPPANNNKTNITKEKKKKVKNQEIESVSIRERWEDISGVSVYDMMYFDSDDIVSLCDEHPDAAALLIMDMLHELYTLTEEEGFHYATA